MPPRPRLPPRRATTLPPSTTIAWPLELWPSDTPQTTPPAEAIETIQAASIIAATEAENTPAPPDSPALSAPEHQNDENANPGQAVQESAAVKAKARPKRTLSAEHRAKISAAHKGRPVTAEHRAKLSQALKGHPVSAETRAKMSAAHKGRPRTVEHCAKLSAALKGHPVPAETRAKLSAANQGDRNPNYGHGAYSAPDHPLKTIEDLIDDLSAKQARLSALLDQEMDSGEADLEYVIRLFSLHGQGASRIARLLRLQQAQAGTPQDQFARAINQALDELSKEWGVEL